MIVDTAPYMSLEQIQGEPVDSRSDIFSLRIIFYGMLTGSRPFTGGSLVGLASSETRQIRSWQSCQRNIERIEHRLFREAIRIDPDYTLAHTGLADVCRSLFPCTARGNAARKRGSTLEENDRALRWLDQSVQDRAADLIWINVEPALRCAARGASLPGDHQRDGVS